MTIFLVKFPQPGSEPPGFLCAPTVSRQPGNSNCVKYIMPNLEIKDLNPIKIDVYCRKNDIFNKKS